MEAGNGEAAAAAGMSLALAAAREAADAGGNAAAGMIYLGSKDGKPFAMTEASARMSKILEGMIETGSTDNGIPLTEIDSETFEKVKDYCDEHGINNSNTCQCVADTIKGKTSEEIRQAFNIENDLAPQD